MAGLEATEDYRLHLQAARGRVPAQAEFRSAVLERWVGISLYPQAEGGLAVYFRDIGRRKEAEERQALLLQELAHRVKKRSPWCCPWPGRPVPGPRRWKASSSCSRAGCGP